jgi:hypothetical protein
MADTTDTTAVPSSEAPAQGQAPATAGAGDEMAKRLAALEAELTATRKEAAERRLRIKEAKEKAATEALKIAQEKGEWSKVIEAKDAKLKEYEALAPKAKQAEVLEQRLKSLVEHEARALPEGLRQKLAGMPLESALDLLPELKALAAAPVGARSTTAGAPASVAPTVNLESLTPEQQAAALRKMTPEERLKFARDLGVVAKRSSIF